MIEVTGPRMAFGAVGGQTTARSDERARMVPTELEGVKAVQAVPESPAVRVDISDAAARAQMQRDMLLRDVVERRVEVDPRSREVVFRTVNTRSGVVIQQLPDETVLKLREYLARMKDQPRPDGKASASRTA